MKKYYCYELKKLGIKFSRQKVVSVVYEDVKMDVGFRADVIVAEKLMLELKSAETVTSVHQKILLTYLRMTDMKLGLLINFREELLKNGIKESLINCNSKCIPLRSLRLGVMSH